MVKKKGSSAKGSAPQTSGDAKAAQGMASKLPSNYDMVVDIFRKCDKNQDGMIARDELYELLIAVGANKDLIKQEDVTNMLADADMNRDGKISFEELFMWLFKQNKNESSASDPAMNYGSDEEKLIRAARSGKVHLVTELLERNAYADFNRVVTKTADGKNALHVAAENGHGAVVSELLLHSADPGVESNEGVKPLSYAVRGGHKLAAVRLMTYKADVNSKDKNGLAPMHVAAQSGNLEMINALMLGEADINAKGAEFAESPLHLAAEYGNTDCVTRLLEEGADVDVLDQGLQTPLHRAATKGSFETVQALLNACANATLKDQTGDRPLDIAMRFHNEDCVFVLERCSDEDFW